jgi:hypothetical protein
VHLTKTGKNFRALGEVERSENLPLFQPLVDSELLPDIGPLHHQELFVELLLQLALPLEGQIRGADDKNPLN